MELLLHSSDSIASLEARAQTLAKRVAALKIRDTEHKKWAGVLALDLEALKSWGILGEIDGYHSPDGEENQRLAGEYLSPEELQEAYTIAVNAALFGAVGAGASGFQKGHSILFEAVAHRPKSRFYETIPPEFQRGLNNGRFWEQLPDLGNSGSAYPEVEDVLVQYFNDLDVTFVPAGLKILQRNREKFVPDFHLCSTIQGVKVGLSERAIRQYARFIHSINSDFMGPEIPQFIRMHGLQITQEQFGWLVKPYAEAVFGKDGDGNHFLEDWDMRAKDPLVQGYSKVARD